MSGFLNYWRRVLALDLRSLAAFRIFVGIVLLADLAVRITDMSSLYSDYGVIPRSALFDTLQTPWVFSVYFMNGRAEVIVIFWLIAVLAALALLIGYRTRTATFLSWFLFVSLTARNPAVVHGGDDILRLLLFWSNFVPLGAVCSVDASQRKFQSHAKSVFTLGTFVLLMQFLAMYFWTAFLKWHPRWHSEGSAICYALELDQLLKPFGEWLRTLPLPFLAMLTRTTFFLETIGPFLVFIAWRKNIFRILVSLAFIGFHLGIFLTFELGIFPWICCVGWVAVLPSSFWDDWLPRIAPKAETTWREFIAKLGRLRAQLLGSGRIIWAWLAFSAPDSIPLTLKLWQKIFLVPVFAIGMYWNLALYDENDRFTLPTPIFEIGFMLRVHQQWKMFAPYPTVEDGWYVTKATLANGKEYDIWNNHPVDFSRPERIAPLYRNAAWRKYLMNLWNEDYRDYRIYFGRYLCRSWNDTHGEDDQVKYFNLYYMLEPSPGPGEKAPPVERRVLWRHYCGEKPENWEEMAE